MYKQFSLVFILIIVSGIILFNSCRQESDVVNVYSGRHYQVDEDLFQEFTRQTGINVNLVKADTDQLINRLALEGKNSPADVFITADAGLMIQGMEKNLLQPMNTEKISNLVPAQYRDSKGYWTGFTKRARVIVYHKERVDPSGLSTYEDLATKKWEGKILVRSSQNAYNLTLMASILAANGDEKGLEWAKAVTANMAQPPKGNDRDQIKAIAAGIGDIAIVNTYYMGLLINSINQEEQNIARQTGIFFPNQNDRGTHINISGAAITAYAPNAENAQKLIEFLLSDQAQKAFAEKNYEYPISNNVEWTPLLKEWGTFKSDPLPLDQLGKHLSKAAIIFNQAGWK